MVALCELVGAVAVSVTSVILAKSVSPKTWILVDSLLALVFATFEICSTRNYLPLMLTWKQDGYHLLFVQGAAVMMAMPGVVALLTRDSSDVRVFKGLLLSRIVASGTRLVLATWNHFTTTGIFLDAHVYLVLLALLAWFLISAIQYSKLQDTPEGPAPPMSSVDYWLLFDAFWSFLGWGPDIICPTIPLGNLESLKIDFLHLHLFRNYGAMNLGTCVVSLAATRFNDMEDKSAVFKSRIVAGLVVLAALTYRRAFDGISPGLAEYLFNAGAALPLLIGIGGLWAIDSLRGAKAEGKSK